MLHATKMSISVLFLCVMAAPVQGYHSAALYLGTQGNPTSAAGGSLVIIQAPAGCSGVSNDDNIEITELSTEGPNGTKLYSLVIPAFVEGGANKVELDFDGVGQTHTITVTPPDA